MRNVRWLFLLTLLQIAFAQDCTRTVPFSLLDRHDHPAFQFQSERLHASLDGNSIAISGVHKIEANRVLVLLDISGSMKANLAFAKAVFQVLLEHVPPGSSVAYGFFGDDVNLSAGFAREPEALAKAVTEVKGVIGQRRTALYDAIHQGLRLFQQVNPGDSLLLITDGGDNKSKWDRDRLKKEIRESGIRVFAVMPPLKNLVVQPEDYYGPQWVSDIADQTGGTTLVTTTRWELRDRKSATEMLGLILRLWHDDIASGYVLSVQLRSNFKDPTRWKLHLDTAGDKLLKDVTVIYPQKLMPCSSTATAVR